MSERTIVPRKLCTITTQPLEEVLPGARLVFRALAPCPLFGPPDERAGMEVRLDRTAIIFSAWHLSLPQKRVFVPRSVLEE